MWLILPAAATGIGALCAVHAANQFKLSKGLTVTMMAVLACALACGYALRWLRLAQPMAAVRSCLFSLIMLYASMMDLATRECDDCIHLLLAVTSLIGREPSQLPCLLLSAAFTVLVLLSAVWLAKAPFGGADLKLSTACGFLLGFDHVVPGLIVGLLLAITVNTIRRKKNEGFPMIPYLTAGFLAASFV